MDFEKTLRSRGVIKIDDFITHAGESANCKLELDGDFLESDIVLAEQIAENLAQRMASYEPRLIIPLPDGANLLGSMVAKHLGIGCTALKKVDRHTYKFRNTGDRYHAARKESVGLVDDVFTTGSSLREVSSLPEINDKVVIAGVIWDRSEPTMPKDLDFPLEAVVQRHIPLRVEA
jgi:adenine/guanine phosphoribosyltransferase-like PRPP-binding protein